VKRTKLPTNKGFDFKIEPTPGKGLSGRFIFPPFSVFRTMDSEWMRRKRQWIALGIESEVGRGGENNAPGGSPRPACDYSKSGARGNGHGKAIEGTQKKNYGIGNKIQWENEKKGLLHKGQTINTKEGEKWEGGRSAWQNTGTSIFDPVLCELMYAWFCPEHGQVIDPFAGGSVRGIVATYMGRMYWGSELRPEQVSANKEQAKKITPNHEPKWVCGDAIQELRNAPDADFVFSCPPYGNLEVYSDIEEDISNMDYYRFLEAYSIIVKRSCRRLKQNRFACFVVANFRDKKTGFYHDLVGDTVRAFEQSKAKFYNEAILITATGSLPVRVAKQFNASRKLGKTHQNVLIFYKGDPKQIKKIFK